MQKSACLGMLLFYPPEDFRLLGVCLIGVAVALLSVHFTTSKDALSTSSRKQRFSLHQSWADALNTGRQFAACTVLHTNRQPPDPNALITRTGHGRGIL